MRWFFLAVLFFALSPGVWAQGEIDPQKKILLKNERSYGILLNSNGFGLNFLYGIRKDGFRKLLYSAEFNWVKHPKEIKSTSNYFNQRSFIFGKLNSFFSLNLSTGFQKEVFSKSDKGGIAIRYYGLIGPAIGILIPRYYEIRYSPTLTKVEDFNTFYENYLSTHNSGVIMGNAPFTRGLENIRIEPGLFAKVGLSFEYAEKETIINAIEFGAMAEAYSRKVPIMAFDTNQQFFFGVFMSYRFGKALDQRPKKEIPPSASESLPSSIQE